MKLLVHKRRDGTKKLPDQRNKGSIKRNKLACDRVKCNCCYACHIIYWKFSQLLKICALNRTDVSVSLCSIYFIFYVTSYSLFSLANIEMDIVSSDFGKKLNKGPEYMSFTCP